MTIKEFSNLCGCTPQTIRYYDRMNLLKPVKVDDWTGYRFYDEEQALDFVKIKNLQTAGFSIDEIKGLLNASDEAIYDAFSQKIKEQEEHLKKIIEIRESYQKFQLATNTTICLSLMMKRVTTLHLQIHSLEYSVYETKIKLYACNAKSSVQMMIKIISGYLEKRVPSKRII